MDGLLIAVLASSLLSRCGLPVACRDDRPSSLTLPSSLFVSVHVRTRR